MAVESFAREVQEAKAAVARAQSALSRVDRSALATREKRQHTTIGSHLERAADAEHSDWLEHPVAVMYVAVRQSLTAIGEIEATLDADQRAPFADATSALHEAEDVLSRPYWRGDLHNV